jgi:histidine triad (HIT) family protein
MFTMPGAIVIEPINPCTPGHVLVVPLVHVENLACDPVLAELVGAVVSKAINELGYQRRCNVIVNEGAVAGQTVRHLHVHLVPRSPDDGLKLPWSKP